jgi:hypothetical protein
MDSHIASLIPWNIITAQRCIEFVSQCLAFVNI